MAEEETAPAGALAADPKRVNVIRIAKEEEGSSKGEFWGVLRALAFLIIAIVVLGYIIS